jgi:RNA 3'-terminal phosphate cyclase (ATP)
MAGAENDGTQPHTEEIIHLDGRMLEGGGQLVRNAVALSALTGKPITITDIRGRRQGKTGLKGSHAAAIKFLSEICQGEVVGGEVGSKTLTFYPRGRLHDDEREKRIEKKAHESAKTPLLDLTLANGELPTIKLEYTIHQSTVGSIFLIFQALYPYLVYASSLAGKPVRLHVTGGTNVSCAPSFEYIDQVLVPNLRKIGLPELSVRLNGRGWSTGPNELGAVTFLIHPLQASDSDVLTHGVGGSISSGFPALNLSKFKRSTITKIDITILVPDMEFGDQQAQGNRKDRRKAGREGSQHDYDYEMFNPKLTIREYLEEATNNHLRRALKRIADKQSLFPAVENEDDDEIVPISLYSSKATNHNTHLYILLVAHMSTGLTIGADALFNGFKSRSNNRHNKKQRGDRGENSIISTLDDLVENCVNDLIQELSGNPDQPGPESSSNNNKKHRPCVDVHMRDQLVIFDALGSFELQREKPGDRPVDAVANEDDEQYWSLHTRTARWVCEQILGEGIWGGD